MNKIYSHIILHISINQLRLNRPSNKYFYLDKPKKVQSSSKKSKNIEKISQKFKQQPKSIILMNY